MINNETLRILEFDRILDTISGFAKSDATNREIHNLRPLTERGEIENRFAQVTEIRRLSQMGVPLRISHFYDLSPAMEMIRPEGAVLDATDLVVFLPLLRTLNAISRQFAYRTDIPHLQDLAGHIRGFPGILEPLESSIDEEGNILDSASKLLFELRSQKRALSSRIRKRLEEIVRERQTAIFLQDDFITQRSGRWVIPVRMDSKGMVPGVVHDVSNTGETAFMEPLEIIGMANELENLAADEKAEQLRILRQLCAWIREELPDLESEFLALVKLDVRNSIATFADMLEAEVPSVCDTATLRLSGGRHPLLMLLQRERGGRQVVPLDLVLGAPDSGSADFGDTTADGPSPSTGQIGTDSQVMVITGPNAGGKTIAIKTTGLLLLMALSGIPVPAASTSVFPMVNSLLVDIGDEQSIEESLSTFSAHVSRIAAILGEADSRSLVLLDELGTGTEPGQGAAIACAVLNELRERGALVVATTHLTDIIGFVHRSEGMVNAAMEFDRNSLTPLYRLKCGEPGESHALEVASRYGLPQRVIEFARGMVSRLESDFHALLAQLKELQSRHEAKLEELNRRERIVVEREEEVKRRSAEAAQKERETLEKAWSDSREIVQNARRELNAILELARQDKVKSAKKELEAVEGRIEKRLAEFHPEELLSIEGLETGIKVFVKSIGYDGVVTSIDRKHGRLRVRTGTIELETGIADLAPPKGKDSLVRIGKGRDGGEEPISMELKVIGLRVDEALPEVERFLNRVSLEGGREVRIVHGKGTGTLMRAVREYLEGHPLVSAFRPGERFEGGEGATVVTVR